MIFQTVQRTAMIAAMAGVHVDTAKRYLQGAAIRSAADRDRLNEAAVMVDRFAAFVAAERARETGAHLLSPAPAVAA